MIHNRDTALESGRRGTRLTAKFMGLLVLLLFAMGAGGWWMFRATRHGIEETMRLAAAGGDMPALADGLLVRIDEIGLALAVGVSLCLILLGGMYLYFIRVIVRSLQINTRLMNRLAVGDSGEDVPARQLARGDEIGDLARALRDVIAYQREEASIANDLAHGDFTSFVAVRDPADMLGQAIRRMADVVGETLGAVNAHVGQVMTDCRAMASASRELSANSAGITAAATEISADIVQIRTRAEDNVGVAEQAGRLTDAGSQFVERGFTDVGEMGVVMLNMQACGDKIVGIAKSIGDIAFQTSLLALNASVEAARAGRHGKGFTIVAEEVRSLAIRTSKAAEETSTLMKETVEQVELAAAIAGRINATFAEIQSSMQESDALLARIAAASGDQSGSIGRISTVLGHVEQSARKNMEYVDDVMGKADRLIDKTGQLHQTLGHFRYDFVRSPNPELFSGSDIVPLRSRIPHAIQRIGEES